jgi:hypothetical protein
MFVILEIVTKFETMSHQFFFFFFFFVYYVYLFWLLILINSGGLVAGEAEKFIRDGKFIPCLFLLGLFKLCETSLLYCEAAL